MVSKKEILLALQIKAVYSIWVSLDPAHIDGRYAWACITQTELETVPILQGK